MNRTKSYIASYDTRSVNDMQMLAEARKLVSGMNRILKADGYQHQYRLVVRGRKPIQKSVIVNWRTGKTSVTGYDWAGNIVGGLANATKLDAYIYRRCNR